MASKETVLVAKLKKIENHIMELVGNGELDVMQGKQITENARGWWVMLSQLRDGMANQTSEDLSEVAMQCEYAVTEAQSFIDFINNQEVGIHV